MVAAQQQQIEGGFMQQEQFEEINQGDEDELPLKLIKVD
jgi:hypothetical protein